MFVALAARLVVLPVGVSCISTDVRCLGYGYLHAFCFSVGKYAVDSFVSHYKNGFNGVITALLCKFGVIQNLYTYIYILLERLR